MMNQHNQQTFDREHRSKLMNDAEQQRLAGASKSTASRNRVNKVLAVVGAQMVTVGKQLEDHYGRQDQSAQRRAYSS